MNILIVFFVGWGWLWNLWPWHNKPSTVPPPITLLQEVTRPPKCITNDEGWFFYGQDGSWGASQLSCMDAVEDWRHTPDVKLPKEYKM